MFVDKIPVSVEALTTSLKKKVAGQKEPGVLLFADSALPCQKLVTLLDQIKQAGIDRVSIQAEKGK